MIGKKKINEAAKALYAFDHVGLLWHVKWSKANEDTRDEYRRAVRVVLKAIQ